MYWLVPVSFGPALSGHRVCLVLFVSCLLSFLVIRLSMEVRSGGGDRYGASWYPVPSTGAVCGVSSTELLVVLCGYFIVVWLFRVSVGLRVWPGRTVSSLLCFLSCQVLSACASGQAELSVFLCLVSSSSPAGWFVSSLAQDAVFIEWYSRFIGIGNSSRLSETSGVSVSLSVSGPVGLGLGFHFRFL